MKTIFIQLLLIISSTSAAGRQMELRWQDVGNGGDALKCSTGSGLKEIQLLDFYEANKMYGLDINLGDAQLHPIKKAEFAFKRLEKLDPKRSERYLNHLNNFCHESVVLDSNIDLPDINDTGYIEIPQNCQIEQVVLQRPTRSQLQKRYRFSSKHWPMSADCTQFDTSRFPKKLDRDDMAGFIIHEIVYRDALERGHNNSKSTRILTGMLASEILNNLTQEEYDHEMFLLGFTSYTISNNNQSVLFFIEEHLDQHAAEERCFDFQFNSFPFSFDLLNTEILEGFFKSRAIGLLKKERQLQIWDSRSSSSLLIDFIKQEFSTEFIGPEIRKLPYACIITE